MISINLLKSKSALRQSRKRKAVGRPELTGHEEAPQQQEDDRCGEEEDGGLGRVVRNRLEVMLVLWVGGDYLLNPKNMGLQITEDDEVQRQGVGMPKGGDGGTSPRQPPCLGPLK